MTKIKVRSKIICTSNKKIGGEIVGAGEMPHFYLIGKVGFKVLRTELMPDGPRGPGLFLGKTELMQREQNP